MGCIRDYLPEDNLLNSFENKVVVNGVISPNSPIEIRLSWSKKTGDTIVESSFPVCYFQFFENEEIIFEDSVKNGQITINRNPIEGKRYRFMINLSGNLPISAETMIPSKPSFRMKKILTQQSYYAHYEIDHIQIENSVRALWFFGKDFFEDNSFEVCAEFYTDNPFLDQINGTLENMDTEKKGSNSLFENFLRIPINSLNYALPVRFSVTSGKMIYCPINEIDYKIIEQDGVYFQLVAPSNEYDQYFRSLYKQYLYQQNSDNPLLYEVIPVFSNIKNGIGIFAGYNFSDTTFIFDRYSED